MARLLVATVTLFGVVAFASPALAYRPFDGTDADVADTGDFELELGPVHYYAQAGSHYLITPATVLNLGFLPRWELVVDFQNRVGLDRQVPPNQLLDTDVLVKTLLVEGSLQGKGRGPSVAVELGPLVPNVNGDESYGASADVITTEKLDDVTIHLNTWFELTRGALDLDWFEGAIVEGNNLATVRPVSEWFVEREFVSGVMTYSGLVGGIWRARDGLDLDMGLREASVGGELATEVRLGLTWTVGVWRSADAK